MPLNEKGKEIKIQNAFGNTVADPGLSQGAKFLVMAYVWGGPKVLFGTYFHTRKVKNWGWGSWPPWPPGSATEIKCIALRNP